MLIGVVCVKGSESNGRRERTRFHHPTKGGLSPRRCRVDIDANVAIAVADSTADEAATAAAAADAAGAAGAAGVAGAATAVATAAAAVAAAAAAAAACC